MGCRCILLVAVQERESCRKGDVHTSSSVHLHVALSNVSACLTFCFSTGDVYFADHHRVRKLTWSTMQVTTLAGTVDGGDLVDGPGLTARFNIVNVSAVLTRMPVRIPHLLCCTPSRPYLCGFLFPAGPVPGTQQERADH